MDSIYKYSKSPTERKLIEQAQVGLSNILKEIDDCSGRSDNAVKLSILKVKFKMTGRKSTNPITERQSNLMNLNHPERKIIRDGRLILKKIASEVITGVLLLDHVLVLYDITTDGLYTIRGVL